MPFLEAEHVNILSKTEACPYFWTLDNMANKIKSDPTWKEGSQTITGHKQPMVEFFNLIKDLDSYSNRKLKQYL